MIIFSPLTYSNVLDKLDKGKMCAKPFQQLKHNIVVVFLEFGMNESSLQKRFFIALGLKF